MTDHVRSEDLLWRRLARLCTAIVFERCRPQNTAGKHREEQRGRGVGHGEVQPPSFVLFVFSPPHSLSSSKCRLMTT